MREVYEAYNSFRRLLTGSADDTVGIHNMKDEARAEWVSSFRDKVDTENLSIIGHSFGGATMVRTAPG